MVVVLMLVKMVVMVIKVVVQTQKVLLEQDQQVVVIVVVVLLVMMVLITVLIFTLARLTRLLATNIVDEVALTGFGTVPGVDYSAVGPDSKYQKNITLQNEFLNTPYKPVNIPPFIPGSTLINTAGNFLSNLGYKKNTQFFADNVAGKYGYGYGLKDYERYMRDRMSGKVGAYGNEEQGQNALSGQGGAEGIMSVAVDDSTDDTTDDTTTEDELLLRFLGEDSTLDPTAAGVANTDELREMILERAKNLYT